MINDYIAWNIENKNSAELPIGNSKFSADGHREAKFQIFNHDVKLSDYEIYPMIKCYLTN